MSDIRIELYQPSYKVIWDTFVGNAKNSTFLFYRDFMDYHNHKFFDSSLLIYKNEKLCALLPANRVKDELFSHQGLTYGGLIFDKSLKFNSVLEVFKSVLQYLDQIDIKTFYYKQLPRIYSFVPNDELDYIMFLLKANIYRKDTLSVINMNLNLRWSKDRLMGYKRAQKQGLIIKEETTFKTFWESILIPNLKYKHSVKPVHSLDEIEMLKEKFPNNIRQFNVYKDNEIVAGTTIFETKNVAHSQYISGNSKKNQLGSLDFLHFHLLKKVFTEKLFFDFGSSNENQSLNINQGLQYWKEGFGARTITQDFHKVKVSNYKLLDSVFI